MTLHFHHPHIHLSCIKNEMNWVGINGGLMISYK